MLQEAHIKQRGHTACIADGVVTAANQQPLEQTPQALPSTCQQEQCRHTAEQHLAVCENLIDAGAALQEALNAKVRHDSHQLA